MGRVNAGFWTAFGVWLALNTIAYLADPGGWLWRPARVAAGSLVVLVGLAYLVLWFVHRKRQGIAE